MKAMKIYSIEEITEYMENIYPSSKHSNSSYNSIAKKYIDICVNEMLKGYTKSDNADRIDFRVSTLNENITNRYNRTKYWLPLLKGQFPFFYTIQAGWKSGDVAVLSAVKPVFHEFACLAHYYQTDYGELLTQLHPVSETNKIFTPIDCKNLELFIDNTLEDMDNPKLSAGRQSLSKQVFQAKSILDVAKQHNNTLPQNYSIKASGRTYMSGINLQSCSSRVREAALGKCYKYDLRTSMFAHMLTLIQNKFPQFNTKSSYINEYCTNKNGIRSQLAKDCIVETNGEPDFKVKLIKKTLAAIGFGATVSNPRGAIQQNIWHEGDRNRLLNSPWMQGLLREVDLYREIMRMSYPRAKKEFGDALKKNGRSSLSKWCSFEYQMTESSIMLYVSNQLGEDNVLLQVHDAIYIKRRCELTDINWMAQHIAPGMHFEYEHITPIYANKRASRIARHHEHEHKQHIKQEEARAELETQM
tara:strand:- start:4292 stop:5707 length:1416 start_codon:yes stop_codon:yes gene_type:complete